MLAEGAILLVVIWFVVEDGHGAVDLLGEKEANHLVREGHEREGDLFLGYLMKGGGEAVGAAHYEDQTARTCRHAFLYPLGKLHGAAFFAVFVQQYNVVTWLQNFL